MLIYPDVEKVTYGCNLGGLVDHMRGYKSYGYNYANKLGYDKFEQRTCTYLKYCNGAELSTPMIHSVADYGTSWSMPRQAPLWTFSTAMML